MDRIKFWMSDPQYEFSRLTEKSLLWIVWKLPKRIIYWSVVRGAVQTHDSYPGEALASDILKKL